MNYNGDARPNLMMKNAWCKFLTLYLVQFLQLLDFMLISPLGAVFVKSGHLQSEYISHALTLYSVAAVIGVFGMGKCTHFSSKYKLTTLLSLFCLSQLILIFDINNSLFLISKFVGGLTGGLMGTIAYSELQSIDQGKNIGLWNGRIQTAQSLAIILGIPMAITITSKLGPNYYFTVMTGLVVLSILAVIYQKTFNETGKTTQKFTFQNIVINHDVFISGLLTYLASFLFISHMANYMINYVKTPESTLSLCYSISGILMFLCSSSLGTFADGRSSKFLLTITLVIIIFSQLTFFYIGQSPLYIFFFFPIYFLFSNARSIYQRGIILEKGKELSLVLHLINNLAVRIGIFLSGLLLAMMASKNNDIQTLFFTANCLSIATTILLLLYLIYLQSRNSFQKRG